MLHPVRETNAEAPVEAGSEGRHARAAAVSLASGSATGGDFAGTDGRHGKVDGWTRLDPRQGWSGELWSRKTWSRETWDAHAVVRLLISFAVLAVCSWMGIMLSRQSEGVATIWLSNGILFGLLITRPPSQWLAYFVAGLVADTAADVVYGDPFRVAFGVSLANSVEVILSTVLLTWWFGVPLNLSRRRPLIGFLVISVVGATALSSLLGASWTMHVYGGSSRWQMWRTWYLGDMLGMALLAPMVFMLQRTDFLSILRRRELPRTLVTLLVPAAVTLLVFTHEADPLTFLIFPTLLLVAFRLGFPGTVLTIFVVALGSIGLTVKGHGPLMLIVGTHMMLHRIVVAQIFLAVAIFTTFPVAALLEEREALRRSLLESEARYRGLANADDLTGLSNRRAFNLRLEQEWFQAMEAGASLALLLLDVDRFKGYNDLYGHLAGDECLRSIARILDDAVRGGPGVAARFGGEEFAVILPGGRAERARELAEQIRHAVLLRGIAHADGPEGLQTVSLGVSAMVPQSGDQVTELVREADRALYEAKNRGRNRTVTAASVGEDAQVASG